MNLYYCWLCESKLETYCMNNAEKRGKIDALKHQSNKRMPYIVCHYTAAQDVGCSLSTASFYYTGLITVTH